MHGDAARKLRRYETGFDGFSGSSFSTAAQDIAFANTTMLQRLATLIANGKNASGNAVVIGEWGLAGEHEHAHSSCPTPRLVQHLHRELTLQAERH